MKVLKTKKSNRVINNDENINETCEILTFWCKTLIKHYKTWCFWKSTNTQVWHVSCTNEFAYKTWRFLMNWCKMLIFHWKFICFVIRARTLETKKWFSLGPYCKKVQNLKKKSIGFIVCYVFLGDSYRDSWPAGRPGRFTLCVCFVHLFFEPPWEP